MRTGGAIERPSPNCDDRGAGVGIDMLVLHYTGMVSAAAALDRLCDPAAKVSAHYLIDEDGTVFAMVPESRRAWHAGVAAWRGNRDVNARSIGIELANPGHEFVYRDFPDAQMAALTALAADILGRHPIPPRNVVGHSDVAPDRKLDPGERFDWQRLAGSGIGLWPRRQRDPDGDPMELLGRYGYDMSARHAVAAFQRHFRPGRIDGIFDEETLGMLGGLVEAVDGV